MELASNLAISTSGYILQKMQARTQTDMYTLMFIALFTKARRWKQPKCPSTDKQISKIWYRHTIEYYLALKRKGIPTYAAARMNVEDITLNEISQSHIQKIAIV